MKLRGGIILVCLLAVSSFVMAQSSVDGTWTGEIDAGRGPQPVTLTLKADGGKVTGSVGGGRGGAITIEEGTIAGSTLKFKSKQQGRAGEITFNWTGTVKGEEIAFSRVVEGGENPPTEFTLKKQP